MSVKEIDNENATKANSTRGNVSTLYTTQARANKYIEQVPSKPTATTMWQNGIERTNSNMCRILEKVRTQTYHFNNVR